MSGTVSGATIDGLVALAALGAGTLCAAFANRPSVSQRMAAGGAALILLLLGSNLGRLGAASLAPGALAAVPAWYLLAAIGALALTAKIALRRPGGGLAGGAGRGALSLALGFSAYASLIMAASAASLVATLAAVELGAATAFCAAIVYGRAPQRAAALPLAGSSLAILIGEVAGAALIVGGAGGAGFEALAAVLDEPSHGLSLGFAILLGALTARVFWLAACYGAAVRHEGTGAAHLVMGVLVLPGAVFGLAQLIALGGASLAPAYALAAQIGFALVCLVAVRYLLAQRGLGSALAWTAIVSALTILFCAVYLGPRPGSAILVLTVQMMLGLAVLAFAVAPGGPAGQAGPVVGPVSAAYAMGAACALAGLPPLLGFWGRWTFIERTLEQGPVEIAGVLLVTSLGIIAAWGRIWYGLWTQPSTDNETGAPRARTALQTGLAAFFAALVVLLSFWPAPVVGALP